MKLQTKIVLGFLSMTACLGSLLLFSVKSTVHTMLTDAVARAGMPKLIDLTESAVPGMVAESETKLLPVLQTAAERSGALYAVALSLDGRVMAHTNVAEKGSRYVDSSVADELRDGELKKRIRFVSHQNVLEISAPVFAPEAPRSSEEFLLEEESHKVLRPRLGTVRLGLPLTQALQTENRLFRRIAVSMAVISIVGIGGMLLFLRRLLRPIHWISSGTNRIARGDYGVAIPVTSNDELGRLADDFNRMSQALSDTTVSKEFLSDVLANLLDPLIIMGADTQILSFNPAATQVFGYLEGEVQGQKLEMLLGDIAMNPLCHAENAQRFQNSKIQNLELTMVTKLQCRITVLFSSVVVKNEKGEVSHIIAVAKDMTDRKRLEQQLLQTGKLSAVGQLAGGVAHEINNPLGVILGFSQGLVRRLEPGHPFELPLKSIEREAVRCKNLVHDLLTFSRASKVEREPMDLNKAIDGALSLITAQARIGQIEVKKELAPDLPRFLGNPNQIQQIIINLANNALDAMGARGTLTIRTELFQEPPRRWVCLVVTDTGSGIPAEVLPRIFEPFFTTKPLGKGTGLGLGLVHEIVQKHSGAIDVSSRPGHTEFRIRFPVREEP